MPHMPYILCTVYIISTLGTPDHVTVPKKDDRGYLPIVPVIT